MSIFDNHTLATAVATTLAESGISPEHRNAFALVGTSSGGVQAALATRVGDGWQVALIGRVTPGQRPEGGVQVVRTW